MIRLLLAVGVLVVCSTLAEAGPREHEMSIERWKVLKEAERFQLTAAERLYRESQWKAAADEYEKFLKLYEKSEGAPYAQLKYSHCLVSLRKQNAAIKDGYQTLLDYFPDSPEAPIASVLMAQTYRDMGDIKPAKKAYAKTISAYPAHVASVWARLDLASIAEKENDADTRLALLKQLTFDVERKGLTVQPCVDAARQYTQIIFRTGTFEEGMKAFVTTCDDAHHTSHLMHPHLGSLPQAVGELTEPAKDEQTKKRGEKLADAGCAWLKTKVGEWLKDEKTKPRAVEAWYAVATVRAHARQADKQKAVYEEMLAALGADPKLHDGIQGSLASWYLTAGQRDQARATYAKFKDVTEGQSQIALTFRRDTPPQTDKAVAIYRQLASDAKTAPTWLSEAAQAYREAKKPDLAIAIYNELIKTAPGNAGAYSVAIADTLYHAGRFKECIEKYRQLGYSQHNNTNRADAHRHEKQYDEAISCYTEIFVVAKGANNEQLAAASLLHIAKTRRQKANPKDAKVKVEDEIKTLKEICRLFPKTPSASTAHARLNGYGEAVTLGGAKD